MKAPFISGMLVFATGLAAHAAVYTFDASGQYDANFREIVNPAGTAQNVGGYVSHTSVNSLSTAVFDVDGAGAGTTLYPLTVGTTLTVSADVRFSDAGSFGFYFSAVGGGASYLTLVNVNQSGANEQYRIFSGSDVTTGGVGTASVNNVNTHDTVSLGQFSTISATYEVLSVNSIRISLTSGAQTFTNTYTGVTIPGSVEIGIRAFNPTGSVNPSLDIDNFNVPDPVPEPSVVWLGALAAAGFFARRRR